MQAPWTALILIREKGTFYFFFSNRGLVLSGGGRIRGPAAPRPASASWGFPIQGSFTLTTIVPQPPPSFHAPYPFRLPVRSSSALPVNFSLQTHPCVLSGSTDRSPSAVAFRVAFNRFVDRFFRHPFSVNPFVGVIGVLLGGDLRKDTPELDVAT